MNAPEYLVLLTIVRLVIPFGIIILLGELLRRRDANYWIKQ